MLIRDLISLTLFPVLCLLAHMVLSRALKSWPRQTIAVLAPAGPSLGMVWSLGHSLDSKLFVVFCCGAMAHIYFHVFNMSETARRIRILVSIKDEGRMPLDAKTAGNAILVRLARLRELRQVKYEGARYRAIPGVLTFVAIIMDGYERFLFPTKTN